MEMRQRGASTLLLAAALGLGLTACGGVEINQFQTETATSNESNDYGGVGTRKLPECNYDRSKSERKKITFKKYSVPIRL